MDSLMRMEIPQWYAIYTNPKQEERAESNLRAWGVETLNPRSKEFSRRRRPIKTKFLIKQLFPRYIFAHFAGKLLREVCFTRGVHSVVSFGNEPTSVEDEIISLIRLRISDDGYVHLGQDLKKGDKVIVKNGPFSNFMGMFERSMTDSDRVLILLTTVSYQARAVLVREQVHKLNPAELRSLAASI
jgi:transcriptional antiterminator RfaH